MIRAALAGHPHCGLRCQIGPHHSFGGHHSGASPTRREDGLGMTLTEKLYNEGLVLQKKKTKILTAEEFRETARLLDPANVNDPLATEEQKLLNVSIRFDPYSPTAVEDYDALKAAIQQIDILGILGREL